MENLSGDECSETVKMLPLKDDEATAKSTNLTNPPLNLNIINVTTRSNENLSSLKENNSSKNFVPTFEVNQHK
jgi:hypothetical protein